MDADRGWCGGAGGCGHQLAGGLRVGGATQGLRGDAGAACVPDRAAVDILSRPASTAGAGGGEAGGDGGRGERKGTRLNSSHSWASRMSSAACKYKNIGQYIDI